LLNLLVALLRRQAEGTRAAGPVLAGGL